MKHGNYVTYNRGCSCDPCTAAATRMRKYNKLRKAEGKGWLPAYRIVRRVRALQAIGWRLDDIADEMGLPDGRQSLSPYVNPGRKWATWATFQMVDAAYRKMSATPGPSEKNRRLAAAKGWAPPLAWDDIDDPDEKPRKSVLHKGGRHNADIDEWMFLVRGGEDPERASARLGVSVAAISRAAWRQGRADVLALSEPAALRVRYEKESA